jgi:hypothetical protein
VSRFKALFQPVALRPGRRLASQIFYLIAGLLEDGGGVLKESGLPLVQLVGLDAVLVTEVREGSFFHEILLENGGLLVATKVPSFSRHWNPPYWGILPERQKKSISVWFKTWSAMMLPKRGPLRRRELRVYKNIQHLFTRFCTQILPPQ